MKQNVDKGMDVLSLEHGWKQEMSLPKLLDLLQVYYIYAVSHKWVRKPLPFALFRLWQYVDAREKEREIPAKDGESR